jgi:hypothetical protein
MNGTVAVSTNQLVKWAGAVLLMLASIVGTLAWHIWTEHIEDYEECRRLVDVLAGGNPYKVNP